MSIVSCHLQTPIVSCCTKCAQPPHQCILSHILKFETPINSEPKSPVAEVCVVALRVCLNRLSQTFVISLFFVIFTQGCASIGTAIDGGKELVVNTVDTVVGTASDVTVSVAQDVSDISTAALEIGAGVVEAVSDEIDDQTDELQDSEEKPESKKD